MPQKAARCCGVPSKCLGRYRFSIAYTAVGLQPESSKCNNIFLFSYYSATPDYTPLNRQRHTAECVSGSRPSMVDLRVGLNMPYLYCNFDASDDLQLPQTTAVGIMGCLMVLLKLQVVRSEEIWNGLQKVNEPGRYRSMEKLKVDKTAEKMKTAVRLSHRAAGRPLLFEKALLFAFHFWPLPLSGCYSSKPLEKQHKKFQSSPISYNLVTHVTTRRSNQRFCERCGYRGERTGRFRRRILIQQYPTSFFTVDFFGWASALNLVTGC